MIPRAEQAATIGLSLPPVLAYTALSLLCPYRDFRHISCTQTNNDNQNQHEALEPTATNPMQQHAGKEATRQTTPRRPTAHRLQTPISIILATLHEIIGPMAMALVTVQRRLSPNQV